MRQRYSPQSDFNLIPIEKIQLPTRSRDELPPILAGLPWIWTHPTLKAAIFALLEKKILAGKKATGRTGMDLWQILVLGIVRLGLDADWDRLEHIANYDSLVRQMLGLPATPWGVDAKTFARQTLRDNVASKTKYIPSRATFTQTKTIIRPSESGRICSIDGASWAFLQKTCMDFTSL